MKTKNFINLTNGIEAFEYYGERLHNPHFLRIQSTTLERKDWIKLFMELDYDFLMYLALGYECRVYDFGTSKPYSKTIYQGLPIIEYVLTKYWLGKESKPYRLTRQGERVDADKKLYNFIYDTLFTYNTTKEKQLVRNKLRYFKNYVRADYLNLVGVSMSTENDGNVPYYRELLHKHL